MQEPAHARRLDWLAQILGETPTRVSRASEDASFRSYWRVETTARTLILMDAPPAREDLGGWLDINARLRAAGLHAPEVLAVDPAQGLLLMEDLGTRTYLPELTQASADALYADALDALLAGEVTAVLVDAVTAHAYVGAQDAVRLSGPTLDPEPYVIATGARSPQLLREVNRILAELEADGSTSGVN